MKQWCKNPDKNIKNKDILKKKIKNEHHICITITTFKAKKNYLMMQYIFIYTYVSFENVDNSLKYYFFNTG